MTRFIELAEKVIERREYKGILEGALGDGAAERDQKPNTEEKMECRRERRGTRRKETGKATDKLKKMEYRKTGEREDQKRNGKKRLRKWDVRRGDEMLKEKRLKKKIRGKESKVKKMAGQSDEEVR